MNRKERGVARERERERERENERDRDRRDRGRERGGPRGERDQTQKRRDVDKLELNKGKRAMEI